MNEKKGFTLIELLAVIVILALISMIATPIILNIVNDSREKSNERSVEAFARSVETTIAQLMMKPSYSGTNIYCEAKEVSGNKEAYCWIETSTVSDSSPATKDSSDDSLTVNYSGSRIICDQINVVQDGASDTDSIGSISVGNCKVGASSNTYSYKTAGDDSACKETSSFSASDESTWCSSKKSSSNTDNGNTSNS